MIDCTCIICISGEAAYAFLETVLSVPTTYLYLIA